MGNEPSMPAQGQEIAVWKWQSNPNPWEATEPQEWTNYPPEINQTIEKAYLEKIQKIQIGKHYIDVQRMIQINNEDPQKQRRVQRILERINMPLNCREERFCNEVPKMTSLNAYFGSTSYFSDLLNAKFEHLCFGKFDSELVNKMYEGLRKEASLLGDKEKKQIEEIILEIDTEVKENDPFFREKLCKQVLRAYTKETFLYSRLNSLLREEKWTELENLAPFLFIICEACQHSNFKTRVKPDGPLEKLFRKKITFRDLDKPGLKISKKEKYFYRGAFLSKEVLQDYDPKVNKYFAWNALTSTSRNISVALSFAKKKSYQDKIPTLFTIISEYYYFSSFEDGIDVKSFSVYPGEEEVILPPGTSFQILSSENKKDIQHITLKIKNHGNFREGVYGLGKVQSLLQELKRQCKSNQKEIYLESLSEDIAQEAAELMRENERLLELHISGTYMNAKVIKSVLDTLSLKTRLKELKLSRIEFTDEAFDLFIKGIPMTYITSLHLEQKHILVSKSRQESFYDALAQSKVKELTILSSRTEEYWRLDSVPTIMINRLSTDCEFTSKDLKNILRSLSQTEIEHLGIKCFLSWSSKTFTKYLPQTNLKSLSLGTSADSKWNFEGQQLTKLLDVLPQTRISELDYSSFRMSNKWIDAISNALYILNLECLKLYVGFEGYQVAKNFGKGLAASRIKKFHLGLERQDETHAHRFIEEIFPYLVQMLYLETLEFKGYCRGFEGDFAHKIVENLPKFKTLKELSFDIKLVRRGEDEIKTFIRFAEAIMDILPFVKIEKIFMPFRDHDCKYTFTDGMRDCCIECLVELEKAAEWTENMQKVISRLNN